MTIPAAAGKTNVDQGASDTPAAGRQDIEGLIDKFNVLRTYLLGSAITSTPTTASKSPATRCASRPMVHPSPCRRTGSKLRLVQFGRLAR